MPERRGIQRCCYYCTKDDYQACKSIYAGQDYSRVRFLYFQGLLVGFLSRFDESFKVGEKKRDEGMIEVVTMGSLGRKETMGASDAHK